MKDEYRDDDAYRASRILLTMAGVKTRQYRPSVDTLSLDLGGSTEANETQTNSTSSTPSSARPSDDVLKHRDMLVNELGWDPIKQNSGRCSSYLSWDDYFMAMAFLTARRSKDPNTQVGACIVSPQKRIVGLGYNGFPRGCSDDSLPWARRAPSPLHNKYHYVCHAEVNAILNKGSAEVRDATLYVALFPCNECAKMIIQAGIAEVVYLHDTYHDSEQCRASRVLFTMAGVQLRQLKPNVTSIHIDYTK